MPVRDYPLYADQYSDFALTFEWLGAGNSPVNLAGATARMMVRKSPGSTAPVVSISTTPNSQGSIVLGGSAGTIALAINNATLAGIAAGHYYYDVLITWPNSTISDFVAGDFWVNAVNVH